ncbi:MAG: polyvinylalcohol dehydrogenase [Pseudomonas sp.]|jgi:rsbT co-antagonist protein RsbR|uniref:RsbT co-antagonist protein RsbR n=1 Tax=Stutzerimonas stutzeri TaxID=316 RepID=A0A5S5B2Y1_STUST|nr:MULTISPECIES: STAS domain-containing protein [Pseudomonadaceae]MAX91076.1 polyvinylalcohol dehydrogenase [Pseudomonas sp.]MBU0812099.1 STAS domain-containing protein [Gammaproteobacteria bacterium]MBK3848759.1 STAS domain-containing protein [Stutzerimonas xanthomarina]MBU0851689.1 STAS domain-containing protein [Gammaproteobacteria bacterium]MBU1301696.1 STAS domain-containing protein [Gammaproteobacteria bacterium]|tara:strand:- start:71192 stop:72043 length:852 start_codon:yes stop_codon:yes gene_type:complete
MASLQQRTFTVIAKKEHELLDSWTRELEASGLYRNVKIEEFRQQTAEFIRLLIEGAGQAESTDLRGSNWEDMRQFLEQLSHSRVLLGFDSQQTAGFIFSFKRPLMPLMQSEYADEPAILAEQLWALSELIDQFGLHTVRTFQKSREAVIKRQQEELLELSTPVVKLWDGVLALPMIGTLDSQRTQVVMESLLQRIVDTGSEIAIIDITGVPTVDTLVAQHLLKTVTAIRLMGADAIISGVRPQIAQTIVHLGLDLQGIVTKASLADALALALRRSGLTVSKAV